MTPIKNICVFGDSIAYGAWDGEGGWVDLLRKFLHTKTIASNLKDDYWIYNLGIPGDTTRWVLKRFAVEYEAREPHVTLLAIGINDAKTNSGITEEEFRVNLAKIFDQARSCGGRLFFVGLTRVEERKTTPFDVQSRFENDHIARFDTIAEALCEEYHVFYIPMHDLLTPADLADGLHPNSQGHQKMFERVRDTLTAQGIF